MARMQQTGQDKTRSLIKKRKIPRGRRAGALRSLAQAAQRRRSNRQRASSQGSQLRRRRMQQSQRQRSQRRSIPVRGQ